MKQFKKEKCPKGYKEVEVKLKSGYTCTAYVNPKYSQYYKKYYGRNITHVEFYGKTISETGYKSWFGNFERFEDKLEEAKFLAQLLENETLRDHPDLITKIEQKSLF